MSKLNLDVMHDRRGTECVKWDFMNFVDSRVPKDAQPLWLSDMEFPIATNIQDALIHRIQQGFIGHSMPSNQYFEAVQGWYQRRFNWDIEKESIFILPERFPPWALLSVPLRKRRRYHHPGTGFLPLCRTD